MLKRIVIGLLVFMSCSVMADTITIKMYRVAKKGHGAYVGSIVAQDTRYGLLFKPNLKDLMPGLHGFHVHVNPTCDDYGKAAGGHYDPDKTNKHLGPYNPEGHLGDLPAIYVNKKGQAIHPVLAPRITIKDILGHSLMIHMHGDNYSDHPKPLGGGGKRIICGVITN